MAGLDMMISYFSVDNLSCIKGMILLEKRKARPLIKIEMISKGRIKRNSGMPAAFIATSSKLSPRLPNVIMEEKRRERGSAIGTQISVTSPTSFKMVKRSRPFPTRSSIYNQKNWSIRTKEVIKKVAINGPTKAFSINVSSFFITVRGI